MFFSSMNNDSAFKVVCPSHNTDTSVSVRHILHHEFA